MTSTPAYLSLTRLPFLAAAIALVLTLGAGSAQAAFPGAPGQIVYSTTVSSDEGTTGGLVSHSPKRRGGSHPLSDDIGDESPSYSANGRMVAFSGNREPPGPGASVHIYLMNADGSGVRALTGGENYDRNPSFSANGRQVVFDRTTPPSQKPQIFIVNVDGTGLRQLTEGDSKNYDPTFAPSGKWIAFVSDRDHDVKTDRSDIFSMRPDGTKQKVLIDGPRNESEPDISPNGRTIAFGSNRGGRSDIYVAKSNGRGVRALTHGPESCHYSACYGSPAWAPDGKHIALLSLRRYNSDVEVIRADGTDSKSFASGGTEEEGYGTRVGAPTWGPRPR
jgi:Tol biopolymer transport system component